MPLVLAALLLVPVGAAQAVTDAEVDDALARLIPRLWALQGDEGHWDRGGSNHAFEVGQTALVVTSLLYAGVSPQEPQMQRALQRLREQELVGTYEVALRGHVWAHVNDELAVPLRDVFYWLSENYHPESTTIDYRGGRRAGDHSSTQYHIMGLWECAKRGLPVGDSFWNASIRHWIENQNDSGSWGYGHAHNRTNRRTSNEDTMTLAGLTALLIGQQQRYRDLPRAEPRIATAINRGLSRADGDFRGRMPNGYYGISIERVALASGLRYLGGHDWFEIGARQIVSSARQVNHDGTGQFRWGNRGEIVETAFAVMFLARGRVPVWATKLEVPGAAWNNRPNDLYFVSEHISHFREGEIGFFRASIDRPAAELAATPVAYLSSDRAIDLTAAQMANLRQYLDLGGLLLANPEQASSSFHNAILSLGEAMYPHLSWERAGPEHPIYNTLFKVNPHSHRIHVLSNGVRDLIVLPDSDWGMAWQNDRHLLDPRNSRDTGRLTINFFALATNRGVLPNRLESDIETPDDAITTRGTIRIGLPRYSGAWMTEPAVWDAAGVRLHNHAGLTVQTTALPDVPALGEAGRRGGGEVLELASLGDSDVDLAHLTGIEAVTFSGVEVAAIRAFIEGGGTVLVETVGGHGAFARDLERQLRPVFGRRAVPVGPEEQLLAGGAAGTYSISHVDYRRYTRFTVDLPPTPRLRAIYHGGRPAVIFSDEDLSLGALGVRRWGIMGYAAEDARRLLVNIALGSQRMDSR